MARVESDRVMQGRMPREARGMRGMRYKGKNQIVAPKGLNQKPAGKPPMISGGRRLPSNLKPAIKKPARGIRIFHKGKVIAHFK